MNRFKYTVHWSRTCQKAMCVIGPRKYPPSGFSYWMFETQNPCWCWMREMISRMKMSVMSSLPVTGLLRSSPTFWSAPSSTAWPLTTPRVLYVSFHNINFGVQKKSVFWEINCRHLWLPSPQQTLAGPDKGRNVSQRGKLGCLSETIICEYGRRYSGPRVFSLTQGHTRGSSGP